MTLGNSGLKGLRTSADKGLVVTEVYNWDIIFLSFFLLMHRDRSLTW